MRTVVAAFALAVVCVLVLVANLVWRFDVNVPRYYTPRITNKASYPKFYVHAVTAFAGTLAAVLLGVPTQAAFLTMIAAIVAWEYTQRGTIDRYDIAAGMVGTLAALMVVLHTAR